MKKPKILLFDIETSPSLGYVWQKYEANVLEYEKDWEILCFAYKWLGKSKIHVERRYGKSDKVLVKKLWALFEKADIVVAHNGNQFDIKKFKARALVHGLTPPSSVTSIDTKIEAKRYFKFDSNKLDDLGRLLGIGRKHSTGGFELWLGCMQGDAASWKKMMKYNKQDVALLEQVYLKMRPWMTSHPNVSRSNGCPNCGSTKLKSYGIRTTKVSTYQRLRCMACGAFSRARQALKGPKPEVVNE